MARQTAAEKKAAAAAEGENTQAPTAEEEDVDVAPETPAESPESDDLDDDGQEDPTDDDSVVEGSTEPEDQPETIEEVAARWRALAAAAQEGDGDNDARLALEEAADEYGVDADEFGDWPALAEHLVTLLSQDATDATDATDEPEPVLEGYVPPIDPVDQRRADDLERWIDQNPDATAIPPSLLPPAYQDGTIITPGLPATLLG